MAFLNSFTIKTIGRVYRGLVLHQTEWIVCRITFRCIYSCKPICVSTRFTHLQAETFVFSSCLNSSNSVRLDGKHLWAALFHSCRWFIIGFRSGLWMYQSNTGILTSFYAVVFISLLKVNKSQQSLIDFYSRIFLSIVPSVLSTLCFILAVFGSDQCLLQNFRHM